METLCTSDDLSDGEDEDLMVSFSERDRIVGLDKVQQLEQQLRTKLGSHAELTVRIVPHERPAQPIGGSYVTSSVCLQHKISYFPPLDFSDFLHQVSLL